MGCIPWFSPNTIIIKTKTIRLTIPNAPIAKSPPCSFNPWLIRITIKQDAIFIRKGDIPIASESNTIFRFKRKIPFFNRISSSLRQNRWSCQTNAINCAQTVAVAAPRIPQSNTKINNGASNTLIITVVIVAIIAFCGWPEARSTAFSPRYKWVTTFPNKITCINSRAYFTVSSLPPKK